MILSAAQTVPVKGDISANTIAHLSLIERAAAAGARLICFPELSLTGYEPALARSLALKENAEALMPFKEAAQTNNITIVLGAPYQVGEEIYIASFICMPSGKIALYTKRYLHTDEDAFFCSGHQGPMILLGEERIQLAICAELTDQRHLQTALAENCSFYLASVFVTPKGWDKDAAILATYAQRHQLPVLMANFGGPSDGIAAGGRSCFWSPGGKLTASLPASGEGLLMVEKLASGWSASVL